MDISLLAVNPKCSWLATATSFEDVRLFDLDLNRLLRRADRVAGRKLTPYERKVYRLAIKSDADLEVDSEESEFGTEGWAIP